ncbi:hypothetical protein BGZ57DRAFT_858251 [Hyaloscypha finlandica]|nr:hypothetical protein BGZ57DRAFT_858251 [Hyaloscypha finlandica]
MVAGGWLKLAGAQPKAETSRNMDGYEFKYFPRFFAVTGWTRGLDLVRFFEVTNTTNKLHAEQGPDSSRAFLSTLSSMCTLPTEDFARLCTGIHRASTSFYPDTPPASDAGSPSVDSSRDEKTGNPVKGVHGREEKLEIFIANAWEALIQLWSKGARTPRRPFSSNKRMRRVYYYHELRRLRLETELHWLRRALSLIRNLRDFQEYLEENGHPPSDTSNHRLRRAYLVYIYAAGFSSSTFLVCGEAIAKLVYKTPGNNNDDLDWLATQIEQYCTIDFRALCGIFDIAMINLLQHYQVKDAPNKFELLAEIQTVDKRT